MHRALVSALIIALGTGVGACGGDGEGDGTLVVSAASSLKTAFTTYGEGFGAADVKLSFAGSNELAAQIRKGIRPDVFAAANTKLPAALAAEGLVERPVVFATNELVLAVPAGDDAISGIDDLAEGGVSLAVGAEGVPVGDYTRTVLGRLPDARAAAILDRVRSNEPDVAGIVGKLTRGAVDAGLVYRSDVTGAGGRLRAIELPAALRPTVEYGVAVVKEAAHPDAAKAFVDGLLDGDGRSALEANGFGPRPAS